MDNIDLFDKYISGKLSTEEKVDFENNLSKDTELASDFRIYKAAVRGIIKEEQEKERELDEAFKHLSDNELRSVIGPKIAISRKPRKKAKILYMTSWISSVAAVTVIAFSITFNMIQSANENIDNIMFDCYYNPYSRSANDTLKYRSASKDLSHANSQELQQELPYLEQDYYKATDVQDIAEQGINLAMVYLKLHDRKKVNDILVDVKRKCLGNIPIQKRCDKIIEKIQ